MTLDPRQFEDKLYLRPGLTKKSFPKPVEYAGNGVILRLSDVRTYSGIVRCYFGSDGNPVTTGATTNPLRVREPFRIAEMSAYVLHFHLAVEDLSDIYAEVSLLPEMRDIGLIMGSDPFQGGTVVAPAYSLRRMEIATGYPVAQLTFHSLEIAESVSGIKKKGGKSAKSTSGTSE